MIEQGKITVRRPSLIVSNRKNYSVQWASITLGQSFAHSAICGFSNNHNLWLISYGNSHNRDGNDRSNYLFHLPWDKLNHEFCEYFQCKIDDIKTNLCAFPSVQVDGVLFVAFIDRVEKFTAGKNGVRREIIRGSCNDTVSSQVDRRPLILDACHTLQGQIVVLLSNNCIEAWT